MMRKYGVMYALACVAMAASACGDGTASPTGVLASSRGDHDGEESKGLDLRVERERLLAADRGYAAGAAGLTYAAAIDGMMAEDGQVLISFLSIVQGRANVQAALATSPLGGASANWNPVRVDVSSDGRQGYTFGYITLQLGTRVIPGKYAAYWERREHGAWKLAAYARAGSLPGPVPSEVPPGFESPTYRHYREFARTDAATQRQRLMRVDLEFSAAASRGVGAAFQRFAASDAGKLDAPPEILWGREAIRASFDGFTGSLSWAPTDGGVARTNDLGFTVGYARLDDVDAQGQPVTQWLKYLTIWKRQRNGEWRYVTDGGNAAPAQP
jgi:ketosteroid isomerase-like protein